MHVGKTHKKTNRSSFSAENRWNRAGEDEKLMKKIGFFDSLHEEEIDLSFSQRSRERETRMSAFENLWGGDRRERGRERGQRFWFWFVAFEACKAGRGRGFNLRVWLARIAVNEGVITRNWANVRAMVTCTARNGVGIFFIIIIFLSITTCCVRDDMVRTTGRADLNWHCIEWIKRVFLTTTRSRYRGNTTC